MKRFDPFWRIIVVLLLVFALAPVMPVAAAVTGISVGASPTYIKPGSTTIISITVTTGDGTWYGTITVIDPSLGTSTASISGNGTTTVSKIYPTGFSTGAATSIEGTYHISATVDGNVNAGVFMVDDTDPGNIIEGVSDYVNELSEITGTASDTSPGTISWVAVSIKRDSDGYYWKGATDSWVSSAYWNDAHASDDSWNERSEDWEYTDLPAWEEGETYSIRTRVWDKAYNMGFYDSGSFTYDTREPGTTIDDIPDYVNTLTEVTGTANDTSPGGVAGVEVLIQRESDDKYWDGANWVVSETWIDATALDDAFDSDDEDWEISTETTPELPTWANGVTYDIEARAEDIATSVDPTPATQSFTYVTTKPSTTIDDIPDYVNTLTEVSGTANDTSPSGVAGVEVLIQRESDDKYWDGANWVVSETWIDATASDDAFDSTSEAWEITAATSPALPTTWGGGETYNIKARAKDAAENVDPSPATVDVTIGRGGLSWWHWVLIALGGIILIGGIIRLIRLLRLKGPPPAEAQPEEFEF